MIVEDKEIAKEEYAYVIKVIREKIVVKKLVKITVILMEYVLIKLNANAMMVFLTITLYFLIFFK